VAHAGGMKKTFDSMSYKPNAIKYKEHYWQLCGDLKGTVFVIEFRSEFSKNCCFLHLCDSRAMGHYDAVKDWPTTEEMNNVN
jgi:hypothetical protein